MFDGLREHKRKPWLELYNRIAATHGLNDGRVYHLSRAVLYAFGRADHASASFTLDSMQWRRELPEIHHKSKECSGDRRE